MCFQTVTGIQRKNWYAELAIAFQSQNSNLFSTDTVLKSDLTHTAATNGSTDLTGSTCSFRLFAVSSE